MDPTNSKVPQRAVRTPNQGSPMRPQVFAIEGFFVTADDQAASKDQAQTLLPETAVTGHPKIVHETLGKTGRRGPRRPIARPVFPGHVERLDAILAGLPIR